MIELFFLFRRASTLVKKCGAFDAPKLCCACVTRCTAYCWGNENVEHQGIFNQRRNINIQTVLVFVYSPKAAAGGANRTCMLASGSATESVLRVTLGLYLHLSCVGPLQASYGMQQEGTPTVWGPSPLRDATILQPACSCTVAAKEGMCHIGCRIPRLHLVQPCTLHGPPAAAYHCNMVEDIYCPMLRARIEQLTKLISREREKPSIKFSAYYHQRVV